MRLVRKFSLTLIVPLVIMIVSMSGCASKKAQPINSANNEIAIGVLAPLTGFMSGHGHEIETGSRVAAQVLNSKGGILGKQVKLYVLDTTSEPAGAAERAKELIERDKVVLLLGTGTSASSLAVVPIATQAHVPFIYVLDGECKTCVSGSPQTVSHCVWGSGFTERMSMKSFIPYLGSKFAKKGQPFKIYYIGGDYVYPRSTNSYARQVAEKLGYKTVGEEYSDTSTQDYSPVIRRIQQAHPDLLIVTNPGASGVTFMHQARQMGLDKQVVISGFATFDQEAIDAMGQAAQGVLTVNRYSMQLNNSENKFFLEEFRKMYPNKPLDPGPTAAGGTYGSLLVAAKAFEKAGSTEPANFYEAMRGLEIDLPQGHVRVDPDNNIFQQHIYVLRINNQQYEVVKDFGLQKHPDLEGCSVK